MNTTERVRTLLGLEDKEIFNAKIEAIVEIVEERMRNKLSLLSDAVITTIPDALSGIVVEVCVNRYNRIGSEGASSHGVEGESYSWANEDYFAPYMDDINAWVKNNYGTATTGRIKFI